MNETEQQLEILKQLLKETATAISETHPVLSAYILNQLSLMTPSEVSVGLITTRKVIRPTPKITE